MSDMDREAIRARLAAQPEPELDDPDNPEWTEADFARATPIDKASPILQAALGRGRGRPRADQPKQPVTVRLSPRVIEYFKAKGDKGWQTRLSDALEEFVDARP